MASITTADVHNKNNIIWWEFDPSVKPWFSYHRLVVQALNTSLSRDKPICDFLGRGITLISIPLAYPILSLIALIGKAVERLLGMDFGYKDKRFALCNSAFNGNEEAVRAILLLGKFTSYDLIEPLQRAGNLGHNKIAEIFLEKINIQELDEHQRLEMHFAANFIRMNNNHILYTLVMQKLGLNPREPQSAHLGIQDALRGLTADL